jgi:hypothetical protein
MKDGGESSSPREVDELWVDRDGENVDENP